MSDDAALVAELDASGLFDASWYILQYPDVRDAELEPLAHFHRHGWRQGRKPNRYFDPEWYLDHYSDVRQAGMNPLLHFIRHGDHEGRRPGQHFDAAWYRRAYDIPKDALTLAHFLIQRTSGRFAPVPELWAVMHLEPYRDDPSAGEDPFGHYLDDMGREGREPFPDILVVAASSLIDPCCYQLGGIDVQGFDLAEHFCRRGWHENRNPNFYFDVQWYRQTNPAAARLKINPVVHYVLEGERARRRPVPYFDPQWYRETYEVPEAELALTHFLLHRHSQAYSPTPLFDAAWYMGRHADEIGANRDPFAHFLQAGTYRDVDPSPSFNSAEYRRRHLGRPSRQFRALMHPDRDNPLVHHLRSEYR